MKKNKSPLFASIISRLMSLFIRRPKITPADENKIEFGSSTQKMGVTFDEKIRDNHRHRWIKKHTN